MAAYILNWPTRKDGYELFEVIGSGMTSVTHSARCISRDEKCVVKIINFGKWDVSWDQIFRQIQPMIISKHSNMVPYITSFLASGEELWVVTKLLKGGSLRDIVQYKMGTSDCSNGVLDEFTIATVLKEVLYALMYLHLFNRKHRNVKAGNILLAEDGTVQLGDFGVSSWLVTGRDISIYNSTKICIGNPCWIAPEVMAQEEYNGQADIWSIGITAIELATGAPPYYKEMPLNVLIKTLQEDSPTLGSGANNYDNYRGYSLIFKSMIADCLQKQADRRPTAFQLLQHPFFLLARDKKYLTETLLANVPSIEDRVNMPVDIHLSSRGILYRRGFATWYWDESEREDSSEPEDAPECKPKSEY